MNTSDSVEFRLIIKDEFSKAMGEFESRLKKNNEHISHSNELLKGLKSTIIEAFGVYEVINFGKEAFNAYTQAAVGSAQLDATLKSTNDAIGLSRQELDEQAEGLAKVSLNSKATITQMQSVLATFTSIKGDTFKQTQQAVLDLSAKMGGDLQGAAVQVGKAIQDPVKGITALRRVGVNFNQAQTDVIKNLVATGHAAKAQQLILKELTTEFGGSAAAAAKANPFKVMANQFEEVKEKIGAGIGQALLSFKPVFDVIIDSFSTMMDALHGLGMGDLFKEIAQIVTVIMKELISVAKIVLPPIISLLHPIVSIFHVILDVVMAIVEPIINALKPALSDISDIASEIGEAFKFMEPALTVIAKILGFVISNVITGVIKTFEWIGHLKIVKTIFEGIFWVVEKIANGITWVAKKLDEATNASARYELKKQGYTDAQIDAAIAKRDGRATNDNTTDPSAKLKEANTGITSAGPISGPEASQSDKVTGQKSLTINVSIQKLIEKIEIKSQTIKEGANEMGEHVVKALLAATNQFSASADI